MPVDLDAIEKRAEAAKGRVWTWRVSSDRHWALIEHDGKRVALVTDDANAVFIAAARSDVPALVAENRQLREQIERVERDLLARCSVMTHSNGYRVEAMPKAEMLGYFAAARLGGGSGD